MQNSIKELQEACTTCHLCQNMKDELCYLCTAQSMINGKWKLLILWTLRNGAKRYSEIRQEIPKVKQGPLTIQLKELAEDGLIHRESYN